MQKRAKNNCFKNQQPYIEAKEKLIPDYVKFAFAWLDSCKSLMADLAFKNQFQREVTAPGIRTAMGLDRGRGAAFVLKSDITYKQWNLGTSTADSKGSRPKRIFKGK